jgi:hypothetical protein
MSTEKKYYKLKLCNFYEKHGKCTKGKDCNYAHGKDDLKDFKKECVNGLKCFKKNCLFLHPENWNYENNIKICEYYLNGYCINEDKCKFKHIKENKEVENDHEEIKNDENININENNLLKNIDINNNDEFPELKENISLDIIKTDDNIFEEENDDCLNINYNVNKNENNEFQDVNQKYNSSPDIEIFVNGIKNDMLNINTENNNDNDENEIEKLLNNLKIDFEKYNKELKLKIDETFIEDKNINIDMKLSLNKIMSKIDLLKNNYQDIIKEI